MISQPNNQSTATNPVGRFMVAVGAMIQHAKTGKMLLIRRAPDQDWQGGEWETLYGRIDQYEDTIQGLKREVFEEVGLKDLEVHEVLSVWHIFRGPKKAENELIGITYRCTTQTDQVTLSKEHTEYRWVEPEEALELVKVEGIRRDVHKFIALNPQSKLQVGKDAIGVGAGALIFDEAGRILLSLRGPKAKNEVGKWEIPGGAIEFGETLEQGLKREIHEELGIEVEVQEMLQLADHILTVEGQHWVSPTYICKIVSGKPKIMEPQKCERLDWFTIEEAEKLPLSEVTKQDIEVLKKRPPSR